MLLWEAQTGRKLAVFKGHKGDVRTVAFSPDGRRLASASVDQTVKLWDTERFTETATLAGHSSVVLDLAFSPDGSILASGDLKGAIHLWDGSSGKQAAVLRGHTQAVECLAFSPNSKLLASGKPRSNRSPLGYAGDIRPRQMNRATPSRSAFRDPVAPRAASAGGGQM